MKPFFLSCNAVAVSLVLADTEELAKKHSLEHLNGSFPVSRIKTLKILQEYELRCKGISIFSKICLRKSLFFCKWEVNALTLLRGSSLNSFGLSYQLCRKSSVLHENLLDRLQGDLFLGRLWVLPGSKQPFSSFSRGCGRWSLLLRYQLGTWMA